MMPYSLLCWHGSLIVLCLAPGYGFHVTGIVSTQAREEEEVNLENA